MPKVKEKWKNDTATVAIDLESTLRQKNLTWDDLKDIVSALKDALPLPEGQIPCSIFDNEKLSALELVVKFLRENKNLPFSSIATFTGRNPKVLAVTYHVAKRKSPSPLIVDPDTTTFPVTILQNKTLSILENIVVYLKETQLLEFHRIARLLKRDQSTIWTVYARSKKKRGAL